MVTPQSYKQCYFTQVTPIRSYLYPVGEPGRSQGSYHFLEGAGASVCGERSTAYLHAKYGVCRPINNRVDAEQTNHDKTPIIV